MTKLLRFLLFAILLISGSLKASERRLMFAPGDAITHSGQTTFCDGGSVVLTIDGRDAAATYEWFKDGTVINGANLKNYTATESGSFHVVVITNGTAVAFDPIIVTKYALPTFDFSFTNDNKCSGTTISFVAQITSNNQIDKYEWDFGDGQTSTSLNPNHVYNALGCGTQNYTVSLKITDLNGCSRTISKSINVLKKPDIEIKDVDVFFPFSNCHNSPTSANPNYKLTVDNISLNPSFITSYSINWGDGIIQNGLNSSSFPISHNYTELGEYRLTVTALGANGCTSVKNYTVANQSNPAGGLATSGGTTNLCAPADVPFKISNWKDNSPGTTYHLKFGDGDEVIRTHPLNNTGDDEIITHTYNTSSCPTPTFTATLNVINACDVTPFTAGNIQINTKPVSSFTSNNGCANQNICFNNTTQAGSFGSSCSSATIYSWNFGDPSSGNNTSSLKDPCHIFSSPGNYTVTLTSSNPCGTSTITKQICISAPLTPSFSLDNNIICVNSIVEATNTTPITTTCNLNSYNWSVTYTASNCGNTALWNFDGGTNSSSENPSFLFRNPGTYIIKLNITNSCGTYSFSKNVVVKGPPQVAITTNPGTCGPVSFTPSASVTNCGTSPLSYLWSFPGTSIPSSTAVNPGVVTYTNPGTYQIRLQVTNECGTNEAARGFTIAQPVTASSINDKIYCRGERSPAISFTNTTNTNGVTYSWANNNTAIGLAASGNGNLPAFTATNTTNSVITATITVTPILSSCSGTPTTFKISVNPSAPTANAGNDQKLCNQTSVQLAANNPSPATGKWSLVSGPGPYTFDDETKFNAIVNNLQTSDIPYVFRWTIEGFAPCASTEEEVSIINRPTPTIANAGPDAIICDQTNSINNSYVLQGNSVKSYETGEWTIIAQPTGSNATFRNNIKNSPTATLINLIPGSYRLKWSISNDVCTTGTEDEVIFTVYAVPVAGSITGINEVCYNSNFTLTYTGTIGKIIEWEESTDNTNWTSISTNSNTLTVNNYTQSKWYRIKIGSEGTTCNSIIYSTAKRVIANPLSMGGTAIANGNSTFCSGNNSGSITLSGQTGNVIRWEYSSDNISFNTIVPNTSTTLNYSNIPVTRYYRAVVKNGACFEEYSSPAKITVNPAVPAANAGVDQYLCNQFSVSLSGNDPVGATGKWSLSSSQTGVFFTDETKHNTTVTGLIADEEYEFKWTIYGTSPCPDTEDKVTIFNRPDITPANAGTDQVICDRTATTNNSTVLQGNKDVARPYETGEWTIVSQPTGSSANFNNKNNFTTTINGLVAGEYLLKWTLKNDACATLSASTIKLTVHAKPVSGTLSSSESTVCYGVNSGILLLSSYTGIIKEWESATSATGPFAPIPNTTDSYTFNNLTTDTWYRAKLISEGSISGNCTGSEAYTAVYKITVNPISIGGISAGANTVCMGSNSGQISLSGQTGTVVVWESSLNGISGWTPIVNSASTSYTYNNLTQTTFFRAAIKSGVCSASYSTPTKITVLAGVDLANAGTAIYLCNFNSSINLDANIPTSGTGEWKQVSGPSTNFTDIHDAKTAVQISQTGTYTFEWTISNGICAPSSGRVNLYNYPQISNTIQGTSTYCFGQTVAITGDTPNGGNGTYNYTWESSNDGNDWVVIAGETGSNLNFTADQTAYFRRKVFSGPCDMVSNSVLITVQTPISNNIINQNQEICIGKPIAKLSGSVPVGGDENYAYSWQSSINQSVWTNIAGANLPEYQPVGLTSTTFFRRIVNTALCKNAQQSTSNTVKIVINPDAKAEFTASITSACVPFELGSVITVSPHPDRNLSYEWFANGISIGMGTTFPGYTITQDGDLVAIKLVTTSKFGCQPDTKEIVFSTVKNVQALFSKDQIQGCGPLIVNFNNLSSPLNGGNYLWDFGNGQTSTVTQPAPIIFQPHPLHRDTTYIITLKAATACASTIYTDSVIVRPKPLAIFSPDKTIGCSPRN